MTSRLIQGHLIESRYQASFIIPNYTPSNWYECDLFEITKAGYFREYEIKLSRSDFKNDSKKEKFKSEAVPGPRWEWKNVSLGTKHSHLEKRASHGPGQFYFVCPPHLIWKQDCPSWAGLIYVEQKKEDNYVWLIEHLVIKAPVLHRTKVLPEIEKHARGVCYWRFNKLFCNVHKPKNS